MIENSTFIKVLQTFTFLRLPGVRWLFRIHIARVKDLGFQCKNLTFLSCSTGDITLSKAEQVLEKFGRSWEMVPGWKMLPGSPQTDKQWGNGNVGDRCGKKIRPWKKVIKANINCANLNIKANINTINLYMILYLDINIYWYKLLYSMD